MNESNDARQPPLYARVWRRSNGEEVARWEWVDGDFAWKTEWYTRLLELSEPIIEANYLDGQLLFEARHTPEHIRSLLERKPTPPDQ